MNGVYIYDCEVFAFDWIVVARTPEDGSPHTVIHNSNEQLRQFIHKNDPFFGGFNNKHYDDFIIKAIYHGADNATVKRLNDFIIVKKQRGWDFPFLQFKKKPFLGFDIRDDLDERISLKAIEGNLGLSIVETGVPFDIDRPLTQEEVAKTIDYCKTDVDNTVVLYHTRKNYIESKIAVARIKGMDEKIAVSMTNAKLTAAFLDAKKRDHGDEMVYEIPDALRIGKYQHTLDFFLDPVEYTLRLLRAKLEVTTRKVSIKSIERRIKLLEETRDRYECNLETEIAGVPHVYAWGGIHGAIPNYICHAEEGYKIVTIDVGSYYPTLMLILNYMSRNIPDSESYAVLYHMRMDAKRRGDKAIANALKLILNTKYGATKNRYNELYDPRNASAICITGQLFLTDLIDKLEGVAGFELIQSNTDGLMIRFPIEVEDSIVATVGEWEQRTGMGMEYTEIHAVAQKDVNNYVMKSGEVYVYDNGRKVVTEKDKGKLKAKGGYVSLYGGGNFEKNSLVAVHNALVDYLMDGVPVEETIRENNNVLEFQMIAKTGPTYEGAYHEVNGDRVPVQKVNRVYATKNNGHGTVYKTKKNGKGEKIQNLPEHCMIDNAGTATITDVDKQFYIDMAKSRVEDYLGKGAEPIKKTKEKKVEKMAEMNIYTKINKIRMAWLDANVQKTGINRFAEYKYFELADIVPVAVPLFDSFNLYHRFSFTDDLATLTIIDADKPEMVETFSSPMRTLAVKGMNEIQALGGVETYQRRYLYMMLLDIVEQDAFDSTNGKPDEPAAKPAATKTAAAKKSNRPATETERNDAKKELIDEAGDATEIQIKAIKNGLKKLRAKDDTHEDYIKETIIKIKGGMSKTDADDLLIEIGNKIEA